MKDKKTYPLDNSAIIHLVARKSRHSNSFRLTVSLRDLVSPVILQEAVNRITPRFPCVIAGICPGPFQYSLVPVRQPPKVEYDAVCLAPMSRTDIRTCAVRFLYREDQISAEFFHSLTDGYGGMVVLNTLVAAYLKIRYRCAIPTSAMTLALDTQPVSTELMDDYLTYAKGRSRRPSGGEAYQLPGQAEEDGIPWVTERFYSADQVTTAAHRYGVSVTVLLSAVMAASVRQIQNSYGKSGQNIQIMVPINLRKLFDSCTLRNFALFALLRVRQTEASGSFAQLTRLCQTQLQAQNTVEYMASVMAGNKSAAAFPLFRALPLPLKKLVLNLAYSIYGERTSCISLSNLGVVTLPEEMREYVNGIEFLLTPRIKSPYNCGVVTYDGILSIHFTRLSREPELETVFFSKLEQILKSR